MPRLLIIADDFTGALDTGVQFAACGIPTRVVVGTAADMIRCECTVLVVDTETRHLSAEAAGKIVEVLARRAREAGDGGYRPDEVRTRAFYSGQKGYAEGDRLYTRVYSGPDRSVSKIIPHSSITSSAPADKSTTGRAHDGPGLWCTLGLGTVWAFLTGRPKIFAPPLDKQGMVFYN